MSKDSEAFERKLRPIYEALDSNNCKVPPQLQRPPQPPAACVTLARLLDAVLVGTQGALKLTNAALEKYHGNDLLKALKAVALQRSGKSDEAAKVSGGVDYGRL